MNLALWPLYLLLAPVAIILGFVAARLLLRSGWISGFIRGLVGLVCCGVLVVMALLLVDLSAYRALQRESPVARLAFDQIGYQTYRVQLSYPDSEQTRTYQLKGDQWQVDARVVTWQGPLVLLGIEPLYRLERLTGRYASLVEERTSPRTVYALSPDPSLTVRSVANWLPWVDSRFGSAVYLPMVDHGRFEVRLSAKGLVTHPLNGPAREAISDWGSE